MAAKKSEVVFDPPIEMDLGANPAMVRFGKLSQFQMWLGDDVKFWTDLDRKLQHSNVEQGIKNSVHRATAQRDALKLPSGKRFDAVVDRTEIENILQAYADGRLIHSQSEIARHMADLADRNSLIELAYFYIASNPGPEGFEVLNAPRNSVIDLIPLIRASSRLEASLGPANKKYAEKMNYLIAQGEGNLNTITGHAADAIQEHKKATALLTGTQGIETKLATLSEDLERRVEEALAPHLTRIETVLKNAESDTKKARDSFDAASVALREDFEKKLNDAENNALERLDGFVQSAKDRYNFKVAEEFWNTKRKRHFWACVAFGLAFVVGVAGAVYSAMRYGASYLVQSGILDEAGDLKATEFNIPLALFAIVPIIGAFWILRQFLKLFLTNLGQHADASERIAMTETFLTLESEGKLSEKDRILIMQALFRPGPASGDTDSGMPPNWFDILIKRLEPPKSGG